MESSEPAVTYINDLLTPDFTQKFCDGIIKFRDPIFYL